MRGITVFITRGIDKPALGRESGSAPSYRNYLRAFSTVLALSICASFCCSDFNVSTPVATTVLELAEAIWHKVHGPDRPFRYVSDTPFEHDVQLRVPDVRKSREVLGFEATTTLDQMLDEVVPWIRAELAAGRL